MGVRTANWNGVVYFTQLMSDQNTYKGSYIERTIYNNLSKDLRKPLFTRTLFAYWKRMFRTSANYTILIELERLVLYEFMPNSKLHLVITRSDSRTESYVHKKEDEFVICEQSSSVCLLYEPKPSRI